jgi:hypothetical protein
MSLDTGGSYSRLSGINSRPTPAIAVTAKVVTVDTRDESESRALPASRRREADWSGRASPSPIRRTGCVEGVRPAAYNSRFPPCGGLQPGLRTCGSIADLDHAIAALPDQQAKAQPAEAAIGLA